MTRCRTSPSLVDLPAWCNSDAKMSSTPHQVLTPTLPFVGNLPSEMHPGCRIRIKAKINRPNGDARIQLQSGGASHHNPSDEVPLQLSVLPATRELLRNSASGGQWGREERIANSPIEFEQDFELTIGPDAAGFNVEINGSLLASFGHRSAVECARYISINGNCAVRAVIYENWNLLPQVISVAPSAPVMYNSPQPSTTQPIPVPFQFPAWPHGGMQYYSAPASLYPQVVAPQPAFNPAMFLQHPLLVNIPGATQKNVESGTAMQYKLMVTVLWKLCCILFKTLKYIIVALMMGFGLYIVSKRLRF